MRTALTAFFVLAEIGGVIEIIALISIAIISSTQSFYFKQQLCKAFYLENGT